MRITDLTNLARARVSFGHRIVICCTYYTLNGAGRAETDARHGAFDFSETDRAPENVAALLTTHESLPWRRRRFEQDCIMNELIKNSGLPTPAHAAPAAQSGPPLSANGSGTELHDHVGATAAQAVQSESGPKLVLAPLPATVPSLPDAFSPRPVSPHLPLMQAKRTRSFTCSPNTKHR